MSVDRRALGPVLLALGLSTALLLIYAPALGRYFVSEDFLILRRLAEQGLLTSTWQNLTGPWLGITLVTFYRPLSTFFLHLEWLAFGTASAGYLTVHLAVHGLNTALVWRLAHRLGLGRNAGAGASSGDSRHQANLAPGWVAVLFALYPLHPNTVLFIASFATLFGVTLMLAALLAATSSRRHATLFSVGLSLLALGCYEQAVVIPLLAWLWRLLSRLKPSHTTADGGEDPRQVQLPRLSMIIGSSAVVGAYFLLRRVALGATVGGYETLHSRFSDLGFSGLIEQLLANGLRLLDPDYSTIPSTTTLTLLALLVIVVALATWFRRSDASPVLWLGIAWVIVSQAPFLFVGVVPGNGRYWYLTSVGLALAVVAVASWIGECLDSRPTTRQLLVAAICGALAVRYLLLLNGVVAVYRQAGATARGLQQAVITDFDRQSTTRLFVAGRPGFLRQHAPKPRVPVAQVFHWGLGDALMPPFVDDGLAVYPTPDIDDHALAPLLHRPDLGRVVRYRADGNLAPILGLPKLDLIDIELESTALEIAEPTDNSTVVTFRSRPEWTYQLMVLAHSSVAQITPTDSGSIVLSANILDSFFSLYEAPVFIWLAARQGEQWVASSDVVTLTPLSRTGN